MAAAKRGIGGKSVVGVAFDSCGRVLDAKIVQSSGRKDLDGAALASAMRWTLGTPAADWKLVEGRYEAPVEFGMMPQDFRLKTPKQLGWPDTHRRARYQLEAPNGESIADALRWSSDAVLQGRFGMPPYRGLSGSFVSTGTAIEPEFWMVIRSEDKVDVAVRYRPVMANGEPVVRLMVLCEKSSTACAQDEAFLLRGLPFAKAR
jgi:TonB family protein